jgi:hypothetical protein
LEGGLESKQLWGGQLGSLSKEKTRDVQNAKETLKTHYNIFLSNFKIENVETSGFWGTFGLGFLRW